MGSKELRVENWEQETSEQKINHQKSVNASTVQEDAITQQIHAATSMHASSANSLDMDKRAALSRSEVVYGMHPKFPRYNLWDHKHLDDE